MTYQEFLKTKEDQIIRAGFDTRRDQLNLHEFEYQKDIVQLALRKGKAAVFSDCGTGKSIMQLDFADQVCKRTKGNALIVAPLAVAEQTRREGEKFGIESTVCRTQQDVKDGINITNYEMLDHFDASAFEAVVLDESSILKSFTSSTRNLLIDKFHDTPYKLCCTATPSPNDHTELGNHAEFLGIMSRTEMLATYFIHDGSDTSKWRLKGHGEKRFWEWVATWAVCVRDPSDLGYSNDGFALPELNLIECVMESDLKDYELIARRAESLQERREARKESLPIRVKEARTLTERDRDQYLVWCDFNDESAALSKAIPESVEVVGSDSPQKKADAATDFADGKIRILVSKPSIYGFGMNWQNCHNIIFCGLSDSFEQFYQALRRCWRYGQDHAVNVYIIISDRELNILDNIKKKQRQMEEMQSGMIALMRDVTMREMKKTSRIIEEYRPAKKMEVPAWIA